MDGTHEIEIKLLRPSGDHDAILSHPLLQGTTHYLNLHTTYYDSLDWRLHKAGASLRIRTAGADQEQTFKIATDNRGQAVVRGEWNCRIRAEGPDIQAFPPDVQHKLGELLNDEPPAAFAAIKTQRSTRIVHYRDSAIEIAFDIGAANVQEYSKKISEIELELKQGRLADILALALELPLGPDLQWSTLAKGEQAYLLATNTHATARKAAPVMLDDDISVSEALQKIAWNCLNQLLHNYRLVITQRSAEALHQSRVALRRLRAALSIFKDIARDDQLDPLRASLKDAATGLGPARDLDVLIDAIGKQDAAKQKDPETFDALLAQLNLQRSVAYDEAEQLLTSPVFQQLLFRIATWTEDGPWLARITGKQRNLLVTDFARQDLKRRRRKLKKARRRFDKLDANQRHRLRIAVKKFRYAADFFASLFAGPLAEQQKAGTVLLGKLQDHLGDLNDLHVSRDTSMLEPGILDPAQYTKLSEFLEEIIDSRSSSYNKIINSVRKYMDSFLDMPKFWKKL